MKANELPSSVFRLDLSRHAAPQVHEYLRDKIISVAMTPGTVLARAELAAQFGLSQTPVRDALMRLEEEGLVQIFPQHRTLVTRIDIRAAQQAHFLRKSIELEVVRILAESPDRDLEKRLRATIAQQSALLDTKDYPDFIKADQAFHRQMYEAADVGNLWDLVRRESAHIDRLRHLNVPVTGKGQAIIRDHLGIVAAIRKADVAEAQRRVRGHLSGTLSWVDSIRTQYPDYVTN
jgi:GntR family transcriptional regulator, rspAB operon transcriptional repressor